MRRELTNSNQEKQKGLTTTASDGTAVASEVIRGIVTIVQREPGDCVQFRGQEFEGTCRSCGTTANSRGHQDGAAEPWETIRNVSRKPSASEALESATSALASPYICAAPKDKPSESTSTVPTFSCELRAASGDEPSANKDTLPKQGAFCTVWGRRPWAHQRGT